jgi:PIN domain nuclease of toxin-antitoxin system
MKLLLDTHIWIWSVLDPERLSRRIAAELENSENELWLSPVSIWEPMLMHRKGRLKFAEGFST